MIKFFKVIVLLVGSLMIFSCNKSDDIAAEVIRPYADQYPADLAKIDKYLDEYSMAVSTVDGTYNVTFTKIPTPRPVGIFSIREQTAYPLLFKTVNKHDINYKVYYLSFRAGTQESPTTVDSIYASYKGEYLYDKTEEITPATNPVTYKTYLTTQLFDQVQNPIWLPLDYTIQGWREILPLFKSGNATSIGGGLFTYNNFGAGVMFLPSGLAYYNSSAGTIPSYTPLIFTFQLKKVNYADHDYDRIDSKDEDINGNGIYTDDDTDGDGIQNYLDIDDDWDGIPTKTEIKDGLGGYYPFGSIPLCTDGNKKHLSKLCH